MITIENVREYSNLPAKLQDSVIETHLAIGIRDAKVEISNYDLIIANPTSSKYLDLEELIKCYTLISLLPVANTFFIEGMPALAEDGVQSRFFSPTEIASTLKRYKERSDVLRSRILGRVKKSGFFFQIIGGVENE